MKIFMGMVNIASLYHEYRAGFEALGHEVFSVSAAPEHPIQNSAPVDMFVPLMVEQRLKREPERTPERIEHWNRHYRQMAWQKALEADVCFFMWETFREDAADLADLKRMGKRIIVRVCGSEVRDPHVDAQLAARYGQQSTDYGLPADLHSLHCKLRYLRQVERYADVIINSSGMSLRPFHWREGCLFSQQGIVRRTAPQRRIPILLHAPSSRNTKGTDEWLAAFGALKAAGLQFGVKFVENIPHEDMLREYATADIVCGSLFYGGRAMWEALSAGCVHLGVGSKTLHENTVEDFRRHLGALGLPQDDEHLAWKMDICDHFAPGYAAPNVDVTQETVTQALADLILDLPRRQALAEAGPVFMDTWFSPEKACRSLLDALFEEDTLERRAELHLPTLFRHYYVPPENDPDRISLFNAHTAAVSCCDWYKTFVPRGERAGLSF